MERIKNIWFSNDRIWMETICGQTYSRPLEAFPALKLASDSQRDNYTIELNGTALRWRELDEDIHISSFHELDEPCFDNEIASIFKRFPQLNPKAIADAMGIHFTLLYRYIYGMVKPSTERREQLNVALNRLGAELMQVKV